MKDSLSPIPALASKMLDLFKASWFKISHLYNKWRIPEQTNFWNPFTINRRTNDEFSCLLSEINVFNNSRSKISTRSHESYFFLIMSHFLTGNKITLHYLICKWDQEILRNTTYLHVYLWKGIKRVIIFKMLTDLIWFVISKGRPDKENFTLNHQQSHWRQHPHLCIQECLSVVRLRHTFILRVTKW